MTDGQVRAVRARHPVGLPALWHAGSANANLLWQFARREISGRYRYHPAKSQSIDFLLTPVVQMPGEAFIDSDDATLGWRAGLEWRPDANWALRAGYEQGSWGIGGGLRLLPWQEDTTASRQNLWLDYGAMIERETGASLLSVGLRGSL